MRVVTGSYRYTTLKDSTLISAAENQIKANRLLNKAMESEIDALLDYAEELEQAALSKLEPLPNYEKLARDVDAWPER